MSKWCWPCLNGAGAKKHQYSVQPGTGFLDPGYLAARGMQHTGIDVNATTGGDSDLGDPVYAVGDGMVMSVGIYRGWGPVVVVWHEQAGVYSMYAHLAGIAKGIKASTKVTAGTLLGAIGKGDKNQFFAHLHFEIRTSNLEPWAWPSNTMKPKLAAEFIAAHYADPLKFLAKVKAVRGIDQL